MSRRDKIDMLLGEIAVNAAVDGPSSLDEIASKALREARCFADMPNEVIREACDQIGHLMGEIERMTGMSTEGTLIEIPVFLPNPKAAIEALHLVRTALLELWLDVRKKDEECAGPDVRRP